MARSLAPASKRPDHGEIAAQRLRRAQDRLKILVPNGQTPEPNLDSGCPCRATTPALAPGSVPWTTPAPLAARCDAVTRAAALPAAVRRLSPRTFPRHQQEPVNSLGWDHLGHSLGVSLRPTALGRWKRAEGRYAELGRRCFKLARATSAQMRREITRTISMPEAYLEKLVQLNRT